ncbi:(2Fe-2S)-binding protein [Allohahella sp. A8]|uniref:(2Fe-2S)-binding protein n=1 Tax=Allohahella sp. A8 TaxID=3141461 RepID=UPI000C095BB6|nr:(2Fe-2S)-binding protein [Hahellaceae bacterium]|tara:strand:- start:6292 stop:6810 length:519 start_codon:yes stop_codon:yes gene_type:complete
MQLSVNGRLVEVASPPDTPLLWVVRDELKLKGSKYGCGMGLCGACTMHLNGTPIRTCITPVSAAEGMEITTIEGLGSEEAPHPLQSAWLVHNVPQCGYCQSGQLMSAAALLAQHPQPSDSQIDDAMSGNLCRCGTYPNIRKAIHTAAAQTQQAPKADSASASVSAVQYWEQS